MTIPVQGDLSAPLHTLPSPDLRTATPDIRNRTALPGRVRAHLDPYWKQGTISGRDVTFRLVENCFVAAEGLVFDATGTTLLRASVTQHGPAEIEAAADSVRAARATGAFPRHAGTMLLCKKRGAATYGHWLIELLPKAALARGIPRLDGHAVLVHAVPEPLRTAMRDGLAMLGIAPERIVETDGAPAFFEALVIVDGLTDHGFYVSPLVPRALSALRPADATEAPGAAAPLLVARPAGSNRRFSNDAWLRDVAAWRGADIAEPGTLDFQTQIALFAGRRLIVGVSGSAMANAVFAVAGARIVAFSPATMPDTFTWLLAAACGHIYEEWRCWEQGRMDGPMPWDRAIDLRARDLRRVLAAEA